MKIILSDHSTKQDIEIESTEFPGLVRIDNVLVSALALLSIFRSNPALWHKFERTSTGEGELDLITVHTQHASGPLS